MFFEIVFPLVLLFLVIGFGIYDCYKISKIRKKRQVDEEFRTLLLMSIDGSLNRIASYLDDNR